MTAGDAAAQGRRVGAFLDTQCVPQAAPEAVSYRSRAWRDLQGFNSSVCVTRVTTTELDLPQEVPWEGKADPCAQQQLGDQSVQVYIHPHTHPILQDCIILTAATQQC